MQQKRSRAKTERKFQTAVLELIAQQGCDAVGINSVAHRAGADKALIYRYFGDLNGLLQQVATSRNWLPQADEILGAFPTKGLSAPELLRQVCIAIEDTISTDAATHKLLIWRKAVHNPLTEYFSQQWKQLWKDISLRISTGLNRTAKTEWQQACAIAALIVEAELEGETIDIDCIELISGDLSVGIIPSTLAAVIDNPEQDSYRRRIDLPFPEFLTSDN